MSETSSSEPLHCFFGVCLGQRRDEVHLAKGPPQDTFRRGRFAKGPTDIWEDLIFVAYKDDEVRHIEVCKPMRTFLLGVELNGRALAEVSDDLAKKGLQVEVDENDPAVAEVLRWGIAFYLEDDVVVTTGIGH